jgi:hypothetical protein
MTVEKLPVTDNEVAVCADILARLPQGRVPLPIFTQILQKSVLTAFEVVPFVESAEGDTSVLLFERPPSDPWYAGQLHTPGVMVIPTDVATPDFRATFARLVKSELEGLDFTGFPVFVRNMLLDTKRGVENANIHWLRVDGYTGSAVRCSMGNLPDNLIDHHRVIIPTAYEHFKNSPNRVNLV